MTRASWRRHCRVGWCRRGSLLVNDGRTGTGVPDDERAPSPASAAIVGAAVGAGSRRSSGRYQPVGLGIGPAPEAMDVFTRCARPRRRRSICACIALAEAGLLFEMWREPNRTWRADAWRLLDSGAAWAAQAPCEAQGGMREPTLAPIAETITAEHAGHVRSAWTARMCSASRCWLAQRKEPAPASLL